jgi:hypothetical protein
MEERVRKREIDADMIAIASDFCFSILTIMQVL